MLKECDTKIFFNIQNGYKQVRRIRRIRMSVVIIGGNECMVCQYEKICKKHGCKAKVFVKEKSGFSKQIGNPDLMILFTNTVSHKMVHSAVTEAKSKDIHIVRSHSSSASSLNAGLQEYMTENKAC